MGGRCSERTLVIVESPHKASVLARLLGPDYEVRATGGHVLDLPPGREGLGEDLEPVLRPLPGKGRLLHDLRRAARRCRRVLLALDPDREGEAIAWHLAEALGADAVKAQRVHLYALDPASVRSAFASAGPLSPSTYAAWKLRRVADRLFGYRVSPLLWGSFHRGLSAGRVQSAALGLLVAHERRLSRAPAAWGLRLRVRGYRGAEVWAADESGRVPRRYGCAEAAVQDAERWQGAKLAVASIVFEAPPHRLAAPPPLRTATLYADAARVLGYAPGKTRRLVQRLYESGLVTYPRTDSVAVPPALAEALHAEAARRYPEAARPAPSTGGGAAPGRGPHFALLPTDPGRERRALPTELRRDAARLYERIWRRALASQLEDPLVRPGWLACEGPPGVAVARGLRLLRPGAFALEATQPELPATEVGAWLTVLEAVPTRLPEAVEAFEPATFLVELEAQGLGRPSTYDTVIETLLQRGYAELIDGCLRPTTLGEGVWARLSAALPDLVSPQAGARLEAAIDGVEAGALEWRAVAEALARALPPARRAGDCGRAPAGAETEAAVPGASRKAPACPRCGRPLRLRSGRRGAFLGCSGWPRCKTTRPLGTGIACPKCGEGEWVERRSRRGRRFFGCSRWPDCEAVSWDRPLPAPCPRCGAPYTVQRRGRRGERRRACASSTCTFEEALDGSGTPRSPRPPVHGIEPEGR